MFSQKKITDENRVGTSKSIKSNRSIQFKHSNEFERFTYVKEDKTGPIVGVKGGDGNCCALM